MAPTWPQLAPQDGPKLEPKLHKNRSENGLGSQVGPGADLGLIFDQFWDDLCLFFERIWDDVWLILCTLLQGEVPICFLHINAAGDAISVVLSDLPSPSQMKKKARSE